MGMGEGQNGLIDSENLAGGYTHFPVSPSWMMIQSWHYF